jgi:hypothetical protein
MAVNAFIVAIYAFFSAIATFTAPSHLIAPRYELVWDQIVSRQVFGLIYTVVGLVACVAVSHREWRFIAFAPAAVIVAFWSSVALGPVFTHSIKQGNILGAIAGLALAALWVSTSVLCWYEYNRHSVTTSHAN